MSALANQSSLPRVVVLLAAYNGCNWLAEQVESILNQQGVSVSLLISVDQSTDGTEAWCDDLASCDARVTLLPHGQRMGSASMNFFRLVQAVPDEGYDYVSFSDQDDLWFPSKLIRAVELIQQRKVDAYSANVIALWTDGRKKKIVKSQPQKEWDFLFEAAGPGCTYVMTSPLFDTLQLFVRSHYEDIKVIALQDWFFYAFARSRSFTWFIDSQPTMYYRQHSKNVHGVNSGLSALARRFQSITNGWWLGQSRRTVTLLGLQQEQFTRPWLSSHSRAGYLHLLVNIMKCRRRWLDTLFMAGILVVLIIKPPKQHIAI